MASLVIGTGFMLGYGSECMRDASGVWGVVTRDEVDLGPLTSFDLHCFDPNEREDKKHYVKHKPAKDGSVNIM